MWNPFGKEKTIIKIKEWWSKWIKNKNWNKNKKLKYINQTTQQKPKALVSSMAQFCLWNKSENASLLETVLR